MKKLFFLILIPILLFCQSCQSTQDNQTIPLSGNTYAVSIRVNEVSSKAKLTVGENGSFSLVHEDSSSPLFGLKEIVEDGKYSSEFDGLSSEDAPMPHSAKLLSELLSALSGNPGEKEAETEVMDEVNCLKIELNGNFDNGTVWIHEETKSPIRLQGISDGVKITVQFAQG